MSKISVRGLTKVFGSKPRQAMEMIRAGHSKDDVLQRLGSAVGVYEVSFDVEEGEIFVVMGLSGSGKSTLLRCVNLLQRPTAGEVILDGEELTRLDARALREVRRRRFGMVFQRFALLPHRTVLGNVEFGLEVRGVSIEERRKTAAEAIELVGLRGWEARYPHELSGGMQQRVGLARALAVDPDVLLMDEAFSALDPLIRRDMQDELLALQERVNKTILFITHDLDEALKLGDRIAVMRDGMFIQIGTPEEIISNPTDDYVAEFTRGVDRSKILSAGAIMQPARAVAGLKDGPKTVLRRMREHGISSIFVVDRGRRLEGLLLVDDVVEAVKSGQPLVQLMSNYPTPVSEDTPLEEVIALGASLHVPIPVVDDERRLRGVIVKGAILAALAEGYDPGNGSHKPSAEARLPNSNGDTGETEAVPSHSITPTGAAAQAGNGKGESR